MKKTRWAVMIEELEAAGLTLTQVAERIGRTVAAVSELKQGRTVEPGGGAAIALVELHREQCGGRRARK